MKIYSYPSINWESNSYLILSGGEAALIDAGVSPHRVESTLKSENAKLKYILLTHGHFDHTVSADILREKTGATLLIHKNDAEMLTDAKKSALAVFFGKYDVMKPCDGELDEGSVINIGTQKIKVLHTPGHSKGSVCYLAGNSLFTGDTLFDGNYGRFDLYGGDSEALYTSLKRLAGLDPELEIYPGHGNGAKLGDAIKFLNII